VNYARTDVKDEKIAKNLWENSEKLIERVEREEAVKRALQKKEKEELGKSQAPLVQASATSTTDSGTDSKKSRKQKKGK